MENMPTVEAASKTAKPDRVGIKRSLYVLILVIVFGASVSGVYFWQRHKVDSLNNEVSELSTKVAKLSQQLAQSKAGYTGTDAKENGQAKTTSIQNVNGQVSLELPLAMGGLLTSAVTDEISSLSSSSLLSKEKELYGDTNLVCKAIDHPLMIIAVRDVSTPFPGHTLVKKLNSGKYLYSQDISQSSSCYQMHEQLRSMISEQVQFINDALANAE